LPQHCRYIALSSPVPQQQAFTIPQFFVLAGPGYKVYEMHTPKIFYVKDVSDVDAAFQTAYKKFIEFLATSPTQQAALAAYRSNNLTGVAADSLNPHLISQLSAGVPVRLNGCELFLITQRKMPQTFKGGPVLAVYINLTQLQSVFSLSGVTEIIYPAFESNQLATFLRKYKKAIPV
jgi:hypothetical protein